MNPSFIQMFKTLFELHPFISFLFAIITASLTILIIKATRRFVTLRNKLLFGFTMASILYNASTQMMSYFINPSQFGYNIAMSYISVTFTILLYFTVLTWTMKSIVNKTRKQ